MEINKSAPGPSHSLPARVRRSELILRMTLLGATLGVASGLYEGAFLRFTPRLTGLLNPDVNNLIWFLAPLSVSLAFALLGLAVGIVVSPFKSPFASKLGIAFLWGNVGAYLATSVELSQALSGWVLRSHDVVITITWFLVLFVWALFAMWILNYMSTTRVISLMRFPLKPWALTLLLILVVAGAGVVITSYGTATIPPPPVAAASGEPAQPNVVLITWDTVRADHVSAYGYSRPTTPNLDRLATQGVLFENAISPSSWTLPAFATMFTGLLPHQHGANSAVPVEETSRTLAEILSARGYETAGFNDNTYYGLAGWGIAQGFQTYVDASSSLRHNLAVTAVGRTVIQSAYGTFVRFAPLDRPDAEQLNRDIYSWYRHRSTRPYFLFLNYFDAHCYGCVPEPFNHHFGHAGKSLLERVSTLDYGRFTGPLSAEDRQSLIATYDNGLFYVDTQFGELLKFLSSQPEWANTYVIVTSDHGEGFGEHGTYLHGWDIHREIVHVPLVVYGPGIPKGVRIPGIARIREIFPTVLDMTAEPGAIFNRTTLTRFWRPGFEPQNFDQAVISEQPAYAPTRPRQGCVSQMTQQWHYLYFMEGQTELYKWPEDPLEQNNLADSAEGQAVARELRDRLYRYIGRSLRPWRGLAYLIALDGPRYSILREAGRFQSWDTSLLLDNPPTGTSQAPLSHTSGTHPRPERLDEELVKSLPYE